jgi:hypothetical protein
MPGNVFLPAVTGRPGDSVADVTAVVIDSGHAGRPLSSWAELTASTVGSHVSGRAPIVPEVLCGKPTVPDGSRGLGKVRFPPPPLDHGSDLRKRGDRSRG